MIGENTPIRVLLVDDHVLVREGFGEILSIEPTVELVGEAGNGAEAVELARAERPDVVLLDIEMPTLGGEEAIRGILEISPSSKVVMLTMYDDPRLVRRFLRLGASGYMVKSARREDLLTTIRSVALGEDRVVLNLSQSTMERLEKPEEVPLTERQLEVLVARGPWDEQPADRPSASPLPGHRVAPPRQRLPEAGGGVQGGGHEEGPLRGLDNPSGCNRALTPVLGYRTRKMDCSSGASTSIGASPGDLRASVAWSSATVDGSRIEPTNRRGVAALRMAH